MKETAKESDAVQDEEFGEEMGILKNVQCWGA